MSAAGFILAINLFVAGIFATAFALVAAYSRSNMGARWLALAYGLGVLNAVLEFALPMQANTRPMEVLVFAVALSAFITVVIGLAQHYLLPVPWGTLSFFAVASLAVNLLTLDMAYEDLLRNVLYQAPYALVHILAAWLVFGVRRKGGLEWALLVFLLLSGMQFVAKPILADWLGGGTGPRGYLHSLYGAFSQMMTAVLLISNGLLMLMIIMRDVMAEMTMRSETDKLSGLLNRRGFEERAERLLATARRSGWPLCIIVSDLDHFKAVNDSFGHEIGDNVIAAFADELRRHASGAELCTRLGGEEFAVIIPDMPLEMARIRAEQTRIDMAARQVPGLPAHHRVTASFGVARLRRADSLSDLLRRADAALYEAKKNGRNAVCIAPEPEIAVEAVPAAGAVTTRRNGSRRKA